MAQSKTLFVSNDVLHEPYFQDYVDNQTHVKDVRSLMVGPVFGHQEHPHKHEHPAHYEGSACYKGQDVELPLGII